MGGRAGLSGLAVRKILSAPDMSGWSGTILSGHETDEEFAICVDRRRAAGNGGVDIGEIASKPDLDASGSRAASGAERARLWF
jgi:hypothetical protein